MPWDINFGNPPIGHAVEINEEDDSAKIQIIEFCSSEDGDHFISRLEGFPSQVLEKIPKDELLKESTVDHMLVIFRKDQTATAYINELVLTSTVQIKKPAINKGDAVYKSDITDIVELNFGDIDIPNDCGILFLFSVGWRKGLFFDFSPLTPSKQVIRNFDLKKEFAAQYTYLLFQNRFKISDQSWSFLFNNNWFPFIALNETNINQMLRTAEVMGDLNQIVGQIHSDIMGNIDAWILKWKNNTYFTNHIEFIQRAVERFKAGDSISTVSILYPIIEGIMRNNHSIVSPNEDPKQKALVKSTLKKIGTHDNPKPLILPEMFRKYLNDVYFANFDPKKPKGMSRNTVSHGVAATSDFDKKNACITILILEQIFFCLSSEP